MDETKLNLTFRLAAPKDGPEIVGLVNSVYRGLSGRQWTSEFELVEGARLTDEMYKELIEKKGSFVPVATHQEKILGCVHLEHHGDDCHLGMLSVLGSHQRYGIGGQILRYAEKFARETLGAITMSMNVLSVRDELLVWYKKQGYRDTSKLLPFGGATTIHSREKKDPLFFRVLFKALNDND